MCTFCVSVAALGRIVVGEVVEIRGEGAGERKGLVAGEIQGEEGLGENGHEG